MNWSAISAFLIQLENFLKNFFPDVEDNPIESPMNNYDDILYTAAFKAIGTDASPDDVAEDRLGCMESLSQIMRQAFPELHFPLILSTREAYLYMSKSPSFQEVDGPGKGIIILSVTGTGNGTVSNGHVGVCGKNESPDGTVWIMSNNSYTGTWEAAYTVDSWKRYFQKKGGFPTHYFRRV